MTWSTKYESPGVCVLVGSFLQVYYVYGFMLLVFIILIIVSICVTIVGTYFLLNAENYHVREQNTLNIHLTLLKPASNEQC